MAATKTTRAKGKATKSTGRTTKRSDRTSKTTKKTGRSNGSITATNVGPQDKKYLEKYGKELSASTKRAKWINKVNEHQDRNGQSLATRNHDVIRQWAEERKAVPSTVPGTQHGDTLGVLRFNFPGYGGQSLQEVSWDQWFDTFDKRQLTFLYQEHLRNGNMSNFFKLDSPFREHD